MTEPAIEIEGDTWRIRGDLLFATVEPLLPRLPKLQDQAPPALVDLAGVARVDSAGLALLVDLARLRGSALRFRALPDALRSLAEVYGVTPLLPVQTGDFAS